MVIVVGVGDNSTVVVIETDESIALGYQFLFE